MSAAFNELVRKRAGGACEYCQVPDGCVPSRHQLDHIIASKHRGSDAVSNRALACFTCNQSKGPCISGVDPATGAIVRLFHPRRHKWPAHFRWAGPILVGRTAIGRTTIEVLEINAPHRIQIRQALIDEGVFPPRGR